jgi:hypothetical protein
VNADLGAFAHQQGPNFIVFHAAASRPFSFLASAVGVPDGFIPLQQASSFRDDGRCVC